MRWTRPIKERDRNPVEGGRVSCPVRGERVDVELCVSCAALRRFDADAIVCRVAHVTIPDVPLVAP